MTATAHEIRRTIEAYGSAFVYDGVLLDPTRVVAHFNPGPNRWAAFTDDELGSIAHSQGLAEGEYGAGSALDQSLAAEITAELERRRGDA